MDELYVVRGRPAITGAPETTLAATPDKVEAQRHLQALEDQGFYAYIVEYQPSIAKYFCSEHAVERDSPMVCKICSAPATRVRHGEAEDRRN